MVDDVLVDDALLEASCRQVLSDAFAPETSAVRRPAPCSRREAPGGPPANSTDPYRTRPGASTPAGTSTPTPGGDDPGRGGVLRDIEVEDLPSPVADHEPGIEQPEPRGGHDEEVHRRDVVSVIPKERAPSLTLIAVGRSRWEIPGYCGEPHEDPELLEFCSNLPGSPAVLVRESPNECPYLGWDRRSTRSGLRDRSPVRPESLAMPSGHSVRLDDDEDALPSGPGPRQSLSGHRRSAWAPAKAHPPRRAWRSGPPPRQQPAQTSRP